MTHIQRRTISVRIYIESVLSQTYTNIKIILAGDGSSDSCPSICDRFASLPISYGSLIVLINISFVKPIT
ncbi:glycosyltransferase [Bifidobacterium aquikefiricola]|uniref:glycosyltransferase n=1 Tax=Bifidobacterium TaxID=1678 RepID=UPI0034E27A5B